MEVSDRRTNLASSIFVTGDNAVVRGDSSYFPSSFFGLVCSILVTGYAEGDVDPAVKALTKANNVFGKKLLKLLGQKPGNLLISPLSLQTGMAMILSGAAGETADEMRNVLGLSSSQEEVENGYKNLLLDLKKPSDAIVHLANKLYVDKLFELQSGYEATATDKFLSGTSRIDMKGHPDEGAKVINEWVEQKTDGFIKNLVDAEVIRNAALVAVNALHFMANWSSPFLSTDLSTGSFFISKDQKKPVTMMKQMLLQVPFLTHDNFQAIKLKYQGDYSMVILLPNEVDGIHALMDSLPDLKCEELEPKYRGEDVQLEMPSFLIESSFKLSEPLQQLGIKKLFTKDSELPGIINTAAKVSEVLQKTSINVTEVGTVAAAATAESVEELTSGTVYSGREFTVDHPFVFVIKHDTSGAALFLGRYSGPE